MGTVFFACYSFSMSEDANQERIKAVIEEWNPTAPEADEEFFERVMPQFIAIKERHLRDLATRRSDFSEEAIQRSLVYLEKRLHALKPGDAVPIARSGSEVLGYVLVCWNESEGRMQIEQFYVDGKFRQRGIGTNLLNSALRHARESHPGESKGIFLTTGETNERAQRLYQRLGFNLSKIPADEEGEIRLELDFVTH